MIMTMETYILTRQRSEEEKRRRHLYGDKGAKFSPAKVPKIGDGGIMGTVTTTATKDLLLLEVHYDKIVV